MDTKQKLFIDFELHSPEGIKEAFNNGIDPNEMHNNKPLFYEFINFYPRGPKFKECVRAFVDSGLHFDDKILLSVLSDDAAELEKLLIQNPGLANGIYSFDCTFTPLYKVSLLHICAEYNHVSCAKILVKFGADPNSKAGIDEFGFGGQTPIFHTVNQNDNKCMDMMNYLLSINADLSITVRGLIWGKGYEWETFIPAVNPISYAMMGLLRQFQRTEVQIYEIVSRLLESSWGIKYTPPNIPNAYLSS
jgi:ankyrin repeat protein